MPFLALVVVLSKRRLTSGRPRDDGTLSGAPRLLPIQREQEQQLASVLFQLVPHKAGSPLLRIIACGESGMAAVTTLLERLVPGARIQIADQHYQVQAVDVARSDWAGISTWEDFLAPPAGRVFRFHFATPVVLGAFPPDAGARELDPSSFFPGPIPLFENLEHRWHALGGPALPTDAASLRDFLRDGGCIVTDYHLQGRPVAVSPAQPPPGFLGQITYTCRREALAFQSTLTALARFAFFAGVGFATERGLGATRVTLQTWEGGRDAVVRRENRRGDV